MKNTIFTNCHLCNEITSLPDGEPTVVINIDVQQDDYYQKWHWNLCNECIGYLQEYLENETDRFIELKKEN